MPVRKRSTVTLHCTASGYGSLTYYWERRFSEDHNWFTIDKINNMTSFTASRKSLGQYRCNVTNEAGSTISPVFTVYGKDLMWIVLQFFLTVIQIL